MQHKLDAYSLVIADRQSFERRLAELLPTPIIAERAVRPNGWRETLLDWLSRPFGHDATATATSLASSGGGRGLGTLTALACLGATGAGGTYCAITGNLPMTGPDRPARAEARPRPTPTPRPTESQPVRRDAQIQAALAEQAARERAERRANRQRRVIQERRATQARRATERAAVEARSEREVIARDTREVEEVPVAPAPASASGNDFDFEQTGPSQPAPPAPAPATGGGEFLP